jgi:hypothetical protein
MTYYVVRIRTPDQQVHALVLVLDREQHLIEQVSLKVKGQFEVVSIQILGVDWPL